MEDKVRVLRYKARRLILNLNEKKVKEKAHFPKMLKGLNHLNLKSNNIVKEIHYLGQAYMYVMYP